MLDQALVRLASSLGSVLTTNAGGHGPSGKAWRLSTSTTRSSSRRCGVTLMAKHGKWVEALRNNGSTGCTTGVMCPRHSVWVPWP